MNDQQIETIAQACHEANRVWCESHDDTSQDAWTDAPDWQKASAIDGVRGALSGNTPEQSHKGWLAHKREAGWKYGAIKDPEAKLHPCMVPYDQLPAEQRAKDGIFVGTVQLFAEAFA